MDGRDWWHRATAALAGWPVAWRDASRNRRWATAGERFLVVRHAGKKPQFYDVLLAWLEQHYPDVRARFELRLLSHHVRDWRPYVLHVPWLQDPVQGWSPTAYRQAQRLAQACDAASIPIINRVDRLANAGKAAGAQTIASTGIRTAKMALINNPREFLETRCGLALPLFVREDWRHGGLVGRADTEAELKRLPLTRFRRPVAVEVIDVQDAHDGLYRKYRCVAAGDVSLPHSMHPCRSWFAKGTHTEFNDSLRAEEVAYLSGPDPNDVRLQRARRALGLDFVAFDYSYTRDGQLVVWEANPYPLLHFGPVRRSYRWPAVERTLAAMARLYLVRAGLGVPPRLEEHCRLGSLESLARAA